MKRRNRKIAVKSDPLAYHPQGPAIRNEVSALMRDCEALVRKCKFLVQRSEFLYQTGLTLNVNAQQLVQEAATSGTEISALNERMAKIESKLLGRRKSKRIAK